MEQKDKREEHHFEEESNFHLELEHKHENYKLSRQSKFFDLILLCELEADNQKQYQGCCYYWSDDKLFLVPLDVDNVLIVTKKIVVTDEEKYIEGK